MNNSATSKRLSILISSLNLTQRSFSEQTGVDQAIICRILKGECDPNVKSLKKIADATKVSPSWLLGYGSEEEIERIQ